MQRAVPGQTPYPPSSSSFLPQAPNIPPPQRRAWLGWTGIAGTYPASLGSAARTEAATRAAALEALPASSWAEIMATPQRKDRHALGRHRGSSSREPEQGCRAGAETSNDVLGIPLRSFLTLIFAFCLPLFFLFLRTLVLPLPPDSCSSSYSGLADNPRPYGLTPNQSKGYDPSRGGGRDIMMCLERMAAEPSAAKRRSGRHVPQVGGLGLPFHSSGAAGGRRRLFDQRTPGESVPAWHQKLPMIQAGVSLGGLSLHLILFSSPACELPGAKRSRKLSGHVCGTSPRPA